MQNVLLKILAVGLVLSALGFFLFFRTLSVMQQGPSFYQESLQVPLESAQRSTQELSAGTQVIASRIEAGEPWEWVITDDQVNGWFAVELASILAQRSIDQVSEPRARFTAGGVDLACRWNAGRLSGVLVLHADLSLNRERQEIVIVLGQIKSGFFSVKREQWETEAKQAIERMQLPVLWESMDEQTRITINLAGIEPDQERMVTIEDIEIVDGQLRLVGSSRPR